MVFSRCGDDCMGSGRGFGTSSVVKGDLAARSMVYITQRAVNLGTQRETHRFSLNTTPAYLICEYRIRSLFTPKGPQVDEILGFALGMRQDVTGIGQRASGPWWNGSHSCELSILILPSAQAADVECMKKVDVTQEVDCRRLRAFRSAHPCPHACLLGDHQTPTESPRPVFDAGVAAL